MGGLYNNWGNEPDDFNGQDALGISLNGWPLGVASEWNDVDEVNQLHFLIKYPSTSGVLELENNFQIYPNPVNDVLKFESHAQMAQVVFRTSVGREVKRLKFDETNELSVNVSDLRDHIYLVEMVFADGNSVVQKLIK